MSITELKMRCLETGEEYGVNPTRDVARFMPKLIEDLGYRLNRQIHSSDWKTRFNITTAEAREALARFLVFISTAVDPDITSVQGGADYSGFATCAAKDAVLALFGATCIGASWAGAKNAANTKVSPLLDMRRRGAEMLHAIYGGELETIPATVQSLFGEVYDKTLGILAELNDKPSGTTDGLPGVGPGDDGAKPGI